MMAKHDVSHFKCRDRDDPITEIVATAIVAVTSKSERDPAIIKDQRIERHRRTPLRLQRSWG